MENQQKLSVDKPTKKQIVWIIVIMIGFAFCFTAGYLMDKTNVERKIIDYYNQYMYLYCTCGNVPIPGGEFRIPNLTVSYNLTLDKS